MDLAHKKARNLTKNLFYFIEMLNSNYKCNTDLFHWDNYSAIAS